MLYWIRINCEAKKKYDETMKVYIKSTKKDEIER